MTPYSLPLKVFVFNYAHLYITSVAQAVSSPKPVRKGAGAFSTQLNHPKTFRSDKVGFRCIYTHSV